MLLGKLNNAVSFTAGLALSVVGATLLFAWRSGAFETNESAGVFAGLAFFLLAAPLLALPFSKHMFRALGIVMLLVLSAGMLYLAFQPGLAPGRPGIYQLGAVALAVLLIARVVLGMRGRRSRQDV